MNSIDKLKAILNNESVGKSFYNLYDRWRDESEYEDINEYGNVILKTITNNFPQYNITLVSSTKRPFGIKIDLDGDKFHIYVKMKSGYIVLSAKVLSTK